MREHQKKTPHSRAVRRPGRRGLQRGLFRAESQNLARRLSDTPANQMTPLHFAQETVNELCPCGIKVQVHDKDWIEQKKFSAFLTVARGSCEPPVVLEISYCGGPNDQKPILFCGKGITFDSGGLCLKKCKHMDVYKADMCGAAAIISAIRAASALSLPLNIEAVIPLCENMPSGMAMKCGDVVMGMNGKSIMITDTDNEGRLALADAMVYGQNMYKPRLVIDVASLTPGVRSALGSAASGVFSNSQTMWSQVPKFAFFIVYHKCLIPGEEGGGDHGRQGVASALGWEILLEEGDSVQIARREQQGHPGRVRLVWAAAFLNEFITCVDWIHFDITGVGFRSNHKVVPYLTKGRMTGRPTRTLIQLLYQLSCPSKAKENYEFFRNPFLLYGI
ncbi:hypothetical protein Zmor_013373 [Zophobas morio]|uniref:Cytosol aminopeptidase domain-containing protein n=1 Tax=Zophobas morio TaxID=2755281 RepID=A0AA38IHI3_9CUCU|nr:hypothetical protein Zmor_013373 [Zophobas morio]